MKMQKGLKDLNQSEEIVKQERLEELLDNHLLMLSLYIEAVNQYRYIDGLENKISDALNALVYGFKGALRDLKVMLHRIDNLYSITPREFKFKAGEMPYSCNGCGKKYSLVDFLMLEDMYGDNTCNECGCEEFTVTARDGIMTTTIGRKK